MVEQGKPAEVNITLVPENPEDKKELPKKKKTPKKKTPSKKAKEKAEADQVKDIQSLLEGVFMVVSLKAGDHWVLQSEESSQIATPLSKILDRYDLLSKASEVSDPVALIVATATIIVPRIMISQMSVVEKKKKTLVNNGVIGNDVKKGSPSSDGGSDGGTAKTTSKSNDGEFIKSIANEIYTGF